jgi:allantoicase
MFYASGDYWHALRERCRRENGIASCGCARHLVDCGQRRGGPWIGSLIRTNGARIVAANNEHCGLASDLLLPMCAAIQANTEKRGASANQVAISALSRWRCFVTLKEPMLARDTSGQLDRCSLHIASASGDTDRSFITQSMYWPVHLGRKHAVNTC